MSSLTLLLLLQFIHQSLANHCFDGWLQYGHSCYLRSPQKLSFEEASQYCQAAYNASLLTTKSSQDMAFLDKFINDKPHWVLTEKNEISPCAVYYNRHSSPTDCANTYAYFCKRQQNSPLPSKHRGKRNIQYVNFRPPRISPRYPTSVKFAGEDWLDLIIKHKLRKPIPSSTSDDNLTNNGCLKEELEFSGSCYTVFKEEVQYAVAEEKCKNLRRNSEVAVIDSVGEGRYLSSLIHGKPPWTNPILRTLAHECLMFGSGLKKTCYEERPFICEAPAELTSQKSEPPQDCLDGWTSISGFCYRVFEDPVTWNTSKTRCEAFNGNLASIHSNEQRRIMKHKMPLPSMWIGFTVNAQKGHHWVDGTDFNFTFWERNEPDNYYRRESCGALIDMLMADRVCNLRLPYMCKVKAGEGVSFSTTPAPEPDVFCYGGTQWLQHGDYCYFFSRDLEPKSYWQARDYCRGEMGDLASLHTVEENYWLISKIKVTTYNLVEEEKYWIGGQKDPQILSGWKWSDSSKFGYYFNWARNEPNNILDSEDCMSLLAHDGHWNDQHCSVKLRWVCKKRLTPAPTNTLPSSTLPPVIGTCPVGWIHLGNDRCVKPFFDEVSWDIASNACTSNDEFTGDLVSIHSSAELATVKVAIYINSLDKVYQMGISYYIGMRFFSEEFRWSDNSDNDYINWSPGEPNHLGLFLKDREECAEINPITGFFNNIKCEKERPYVCQQKTNTALMTEDEVKMEDNFPTCDPPFDSYFKFENNCYKIIREKKTWKDAKEFCEKDGAGLVSVLHHLENLVMWVVTQRDDQDYFLGINKIKDMDKYEWTDGWPVFFTSWEDISSKETLQCTVLDHQTGLWKPVACETPQSFICKYTNLNGSSIPTPDPPIKGKCPNGTWKDLGGSHCYLFVEEETWPFHEANWRCLREGAQLVSIHNEVELDHISKAAPFHDIFYIGLVQQGNEYGWTDGSPLDYTSWFSGEPNRLDIEKCVDMDPVRKRWNNIPCDVLRRVVCKIKKIPDTEDSTPTADKLVSSQHSYVNSVAIFGIMATVLLILVMVIFVTFKVIKKRRVYHSPNHTFTNMIYNENKIDEVNVEAH